MMFFWIAGSWSKGTSTPISPRAIITPSAISRIGSRFSIPDLFSIFAMILIFSPPLTFNSFLSFFTSSWFLTKEAAMKSKSSSMPKRISLLSRSLMKIWSTSIPGTFMDFLEDILAPLSTEHTISPFFTSVTVKDTRPSSTRILSPVLTSSPRYGYVIPTPFWSPSLDRSW